MIGFLPGTTPASLYDDLKTLAAPVTTFVSGGKYAPRSKAMDQNLKDSIMSQYDKTGIMSGVLGYSDFDKSQTPGTAFPDLPLMSSNLFSGKVSPAQFSNAMTGGRLTYDINPDTGKVTFGSNKYNFDPANAVIDPSENLAQQAFSYLAGKANERNREINPDISIPVDYLRGFGRDFSQFGDPDSFRSRMSNNRFDELPSTRQTSSPRAAGAEDIKEEGIFSLGDILADLGRKGVEGFKDVAGRSIASQGLGTAGGMILGPMGALAGGIFGALKGGDMFTPSQSQIDFNALTPEGKAAVGDIYGPGGIMSGYNAVSAFGRGPVGAIDARLDKLGTRRAPQTDLSRQRAKDLFAAREKIMQTTLDSDSQYTGPKSSPRGQKAGVMDDDPFGGTSETTGTSSKIVCTMMNDSYGFGNFRNKIWLKHSKDLPKEYEIGYHKIFLPLVKFAKGQGKLNKVVKKTLEHVARHRTLDLKQEMKGKTHLLGRIYRKILEPICFIVGKVSNNV